MDSKSIGLCPQGFESASCRLSWLGHASQAQRLPQALYVVPPTRHCFSFVVFVCLALRGRGWGSLQREDSSPVDTPGWSVWCARHGVSRCTVLAQACKPNVHLEPTWLWRLCVDKKRTYTLIIHGFWAEYHYNGQRRIAKETEIKPHTRKVRELEDGGRGQPSMHTLPCCCVFCFHWGAVRHSAARHAIKLQRSATHKM